MLILVEYPGCFALACGDHVSRQFREEQDVERTVLERRDEPGNLEVCVGIFVEALGVEESPVAQSANVFCKADYEIVHRLATPLVPDEDARWVSPPQWAHTLPHRREPKHCQADGKRALLPGDPVYRLRVGSVELGHQVLDALHLATLPNASDRKSTR